MEQIKLNYRHFISRKQANKMNQKRNRKVNASSSYGHPHYQSHHLFIKRSLDANSSNKNRIKNSNFPNLPIEILHENGHQSDFVNNNKKVRNECYPQYNYESHNGNKNVMMEDEDTRTNEETTKDSTEYSEAQQTIAGLLDGLFDETPPKQSQSRKTLDTPSKITMSPFANTWTQVGHIFVLFLRTN
ncbi:hypothetical protein RFI_07291 [Reticulomyxa filosa]|uniref:Uncharacterized protein n=1 Tax=Reticulomyxa filosa TaxID=46433 RepID=X6NU59_RETFI|nr:hypothetical protein RFI_07291 [Reticulomyxa filosa]|eukprot:ETO29830.1 hypothetical protein RFI_07291 [Reticulomyxa filosa]